MTASRLFHRLAGFAIGIACVTSAVSAQGEREVVGKYRIREPWLDASGRPLVGIVGDRRLTVDGLDLRLNLMLENVSTIRSPDPERQAEKQKQRRLDYANGILVDWAENAVLASEAQRRGYTVSQTELEESLAELRGQSVSWDREQDLSLRMIGIPESELLSEARDGLLIEKFISDVMKARYTEATYRELFDAEPSAFLIPPRVRAFHVYRMIDGSMTTRQRKDVRKEMDKMRRLLKKRKPDYGELAERSDKGGKKVTIGDMGWVTGDTTTISARMYQALFSMEPGETSKPFQDAHGVHIVRILEREEGSSREFADALPRVQNYVFAKTRHVVYAQVAPSYRIRIRANGLTRGREVTHEEYLRLRDSAVGGDADQAPRRRVRAERVDSTPARRPEPLRGVSRSSLPEAPAVDLSILPPPPPASKKTGRAPPRD